jgi:hypothetical protein
LVFFDRFFFSERECGKILDGEDGSWNVSRELVYGKWSQGGPVSPCELDVVVAGDVTEALMS